MELLVEYLELRTGRAARRRATPARDRAPNEKLRKVVSAINRGVPAKRALTLVNRAPVTLASVRPAAQQVFRRIRHPSRTEEHDCEILRQAGIRQDQLPGPFDYRRDGFLRGYFRQRLSSRVLGISTLVLAVTGFVWILVT